MTGHEWTCERCRSHDRWIGWRNGPAHEGWPRKAQCVPCGHVQPLPKPITVDTTRLEEALLLSEPQDLPDHLREAPLRHTPVGICRWSTDMTDRDIAFWEDTYFQPGPLPWRRSLAAAALVSAGIRQLLDGRDLTVHHLLPRQEHP